MVRKNVKTEGFENAAKFANLDPEDDELMAVQVVEFDNSKFTLQQINPFSLWKIVPQNGIVPKDLEGGFTSPAKAEQAIEIYCNNRRKK